jgi:hypothetical protein
VLWRESSIHPTVDGQNDKGQRKSGERAEGFSSLYLLPLPFGLIMMLRSTKL